jgi:uncharacterized membrane protein YeiH
VTNAVLILDFISTFAFALVGAKVAALKGMDYGGITFVAAVSALSGGTFRNMALQVQVAWLSHPYLSLQHGAQPFAAVVLGVLSAVLGGLIRDVLCQTPPVLLHRETNGTATLFGVIVFTILYKLDLQIAINSLISGFVVMAIRLASIKYKWNLPKLKK